MGAECRRRARPQLGYGRKTDFVTRHLVPGKGHSAERMGTPPVVMGCSLPPFLPSISLSLHHSHAPGQPQQLLQPLDLHALHWPPLPRTCTALPLLLLQLPEGQPAGRDQRQQKEQLIHLCPEPPQLQPEELLAAICSVTSLGQDCLLRLSLCQHGQSAPWWPVRVCMRYLSVCTLSHLEVA